MLRRATRLDPRGCTTRVGSRIEQILRTRCQPRDGGRGIQLSFQPLHLRAHAGQARSIAAACSTNSSHAKSSTTRHTKTVLHHHHATAGSQEAEHSEAPCETPVRTECCQAMISCGGTIFSSGTSTSIPPQHERAIVTP